jgi:uncharacterized RDD family membrane protein YckC
MEFWEDYEMLVVETPEHLELRLPLAGLGPRFLAYLIDSLIVGAGVVVLCLIMLAVGFALAEWVGSLGESAIVVLLIIAIVLVLLSPIIYYIVFESLWNGQTPGKRITGIRVVMRGGVPLTFRAVMYRNLMRMIDSLPTQFFAGIVSFFATRFQQRLGDLVADTVVIREFTTKLPFLWVGNAPTATVAQGVPAPLLSYVIGNYLQRRHQLDSPYRERLSRACIERLGYDPSGLTVQQRESYLLSVVQSSWSSQ